MAVNRQKLYDRALDFANLQGSAVMKLSQGKADGKAVTALLNQKRS